MKFKRRIIKKQDGSVVIKSEFTLTEAEAKAVERIPDDPNVGLAILKCQENSPSTTVDVYLSYLRILCYWVHLYNNSEEPHIKKALLQAQQHRRTSEQFISRKKKRRRK